MPHHSKLFRFASPPFSACRFFSIPLLISSLQFRCFSNPDGSSPFQCRATQNHATPSQFASLLFRVQLIVSRHIANQCRCISVLRFAVSSPVLAMLCHFYSHPFGQRHSHAMQLIANPFRILLGYAILFHFATWRCFTSPCHRFTFPFSSLPTQSLSELCHCLSNPCNAHAVHFHSSPCRHCAIQRLSLLWLNFSAPCLSTAELISDFFPCEAALSGISPLTDSVQNSGVEPFSDVLLQLRIERSDIKLTP